MHHPRYTEIAFLFMFLLSQFANAQPLPEIIVKRESSQGLPGMEGEEVDVWRLCRSSGLFPMLPYPADRPFGDQILLNADRIESDNTSASKLLGNVTVVREKDQIRADSAVYSSARQRIDLSGNVLYRSEFLDFNADSMTSQTNSDSAEADRLNFYIAAGHANGSAEYLARNDEEVTHLRNLTYSTCDSGNRDWYFKASELKLDHGKGVGFAKHMTLRLKNVPIFYFPAMSFPIGDQRKSGFLFPTIGHSSRHGYELELPYYWNIAPQADATLTPHHMSERGLKLNTEWRFMNSWSKNTLVYEYLDDDKYIEDQLLSNERAGITGTDNINFNSKRSLQQLSHSGRLGSNWSTNINATRLSDKDYFIDFGESLNTTSATHVVRIASLTGQWNNWRFVSKFQSYQTVDKTIPDSASPYRLSPQLELTGFYSDIGAGIELSVESSYTNFERKNIVSNERFDTWTRFSRPFGNRGWFVTPAVSSRYTAYRVEQTNIAAIPEVTDFKRTIPTASLDTGLIFERLVGGSGGRYTQTFEPRISYLYTPFRDQSDFPVLDTREPNFGLYQLTEENRFTGIDRIGDADQASLSLSTRWLRRSTGEERIKISLGQIYYNDDRRVTLYNQPPETGKKSGVLAEIETQFGRYWSKSLDLEWNPESEKIDKGLFRLKYNRQNRYIFNVGYRYRRNAKTNNQNPGGPVKQDFEQADVSFSLPIGSKWSVVGRWNHSIDEKLDLDKYFGVEYESCCWAFRVLGREFITGLEALNSTATITEPKLDKSIFFEFVFKGFASSGGSISRRLEQNITGYKDPFE